MAKSIRIPWLIDLRKVDDKPEMRALAIDQRLDRGFTQRGPLINRLLVQHVASTLQFDGKPLPAIAPRDYPDRAKNQAALRARLDPAKPLWDAATLATLVATVRGTRSADEIGPAAQQAVGRLFVPNYAGDADSWRAARDLDDALRKPLRGTLLRLTGRLRRSRNLLSRRVNGDLAGVHGTGVAVHNMVRGFAHMRELWRSAPRPAADEVVRRCLYAPESVLREATQRGATVAGEVQPGSLMMLQLDAIRAHAPGDADVVFMAGTWAECPAIAFVPALLRAVWDGAIAAEKGENRT